MYCAFVRNLSSDDAQRKEKDSIEPKNVHFK